MAGNYDVAVVGLGAMGSASAYHLAKQGLSVIGFDRFHPPHSFGSSHGQSRVIREAYFEHPNYVPIVQRAYELWAELESDSGHELFLQTGGLMIGRSESTLVSGAKSSADIHALPYEVLTFAEIHERFPAFSPDEGVVAVWEPRAGILFPERCIETQLDLAKAAGAELHYGEEVESWESASDGVILRTAKGEFKADKLILAAGPWISDFLNELEISIQPARQPLFWIEPKANWESFAPQNFPIYMWEYVVEKYFYGFPDLGNGVKAALHYQGQNTNANEIDREVLKNEETNIIEVLKNRIPDAAGEVISSEVCMYTNTKDLHFIIDKYPKQDNVWILSPCSGHGFKFSCAIGAMMPDLLAGNKIDFDLSLFSIDRFI